MMIRDIEHYWELDGSTDGPPCYFTRKQAQNQGRCRAVIFQVDGMYSVGVRTNHSAAQGFSPVCRLLKSEHTLDEAKAIAEHAVMMGLDTYDAPADMS